jgi:hypothetical protein
MIKIVWVFNGIGSKFPSGVFTDIENAEKWIKLHRLSGLLTAYPLDLGLFDWAIENNFFSPKGEEHLSSEFIGRFSSASQEHYHYENGNKE